MEYEKDCSLTDEVVPVDFTICMNEQAVISVSEYTRLKANRENTTLEMARICVPLIWYTPRLEWLTLELEHLNHLPDGLRIPLLFERLSWMQRIAIMRKLKKTRNAFAFRSRTYCPKKSVRHCLAMALRYAGQTTHIKHCHSICNIFFATLQYRMQVRHWDGNAKIRF